MLVILVGGTLEVARNSRAYFENKGYEVIQKYNYLPPDSLSAHYDSFTNLEEETVMQCDFVYDIHGGKTGFYKAQILDAVRGRSNALMTMSPDSLDFVREIQDSFGEYVLTIYLYIDHTSLEAMTRKYIKKEEDIVRRLNKGAALRQMYLENMGLFNRVVLYAEGSNLDFESLYAQYDRIIDDAETLQKRLNDKLYVDLPYTGTQDYIFVSYSHKDSKQVLPYLSALQREGYRVWYDEGIHKGANWTIMLGERLAGCTDFVLFSSANSAASQRVGDEINGAIMCPHIHPITVKLDESSFPFGYEMYLSKYQKIDITKGEGIEQIKKAMAPSTKD